VIEDPDHQTDWRAVLDAAPRGKLPTFQWMTTRASTRAHVFASTLPDRSICGFVTRVPDSHWDPQPAPPGSEGCSKCAGVGPHFRDSTRWCRGCGPTTKPRRDGTAPKHYLPTQNVCPGFGLPVLATGPGGPPPGRVRMVSDTNCSRRPVRCLSRRCRSWATTATSWSSVLCQSLRRCSPPPLV
jgi:hypothetical protein